MAVDPFFSVCNVYSNATLVLVFLTTLFIAYHLTRRASKVPPGPPLWPIFGNLFSMIDKDLFKKLAIIRQRYGNIFSLYIGSELWVFLNGYDVIYDALVKKGRLFSRRPSDQYTRRFGFSAIAMENGIAWKERRSFLLLALRKLCFADDGKYIEGVVQNEASHCLNDIRKIPNLITDPSSLITCSYMNIIIMLMYGKRLNNDNGDLKKIVEASEKGLKMYARFKILSSLIPFEWFPWKRLGVVSHEGISAIREFNWRMISNTIGNTEDARETCLTHQYMKVLKTEEINGKPVSKGSFSMDSLNSLFQDIVVAGSETSATVTKWIILYLAFNIELQRKIQREIDHIIPRERLPLLSDRSCLPIVEATILEGLRIGMIVPLSVPRTVTEDTIFRGYLITKNTAVIPNLSSVFMDPEIFPEPDVFKPERFLDETGRQVLVPKQMVPFSLGLRSCPGETLARLEIFLFITAILQQFELRFPKGVKEPSLIGVLAETYHPQAYKIEFVPRVE